MDENKNMNAEVIAVYPNKVRISVDDLSKFISTDEQVEKLKVGSYLEIADDDNHKLIAIIESYSIIIGEKEPFKRFYIIEANPLGIIEGNKFSRGGDSLTIPPTKVLPAKQEDIDAIFNSGIEQKERFCFSKLAQNENIKTPVNGNRFFNKHFAIVGSTGSGKSHTVAKILQEAISKKEKEYEGLNNSHIVLFDIHGEYKAAFPSCNYIEAGNLSLPYWLLNETELEELFLDTGDRNNYNQTSILRRTIIENKRKFNPDEKIHFGTPSKFDINEVYNCLCNFQNEMVDYTNNLCVKKLGKDVVCENIEDKYKSFFTEIMDFEAAVRSKIKSGIYADGTLDKFIDRFENKIHNKRLKFLFGDESRDSSFEDTMKQFVGYKIDNSNSNKNITIIDLGGVPFEVLSITVSLITRILFEFGFYYKKYLDTEKKICETPLLLIYEEAHKYVPKSELAKFRASKNAIERIAKEGRKYGVTLGIISQRPSEISETIFSQCNTFIAMRLTNPDDQNYVKRLLPDSMGNITDTLPSLKTGEALLIGESIEMPCIVKIDECEKDKPSSNDIKYIEIWQEQWKNVNFEKIIEEWKK
ncbi:MAG TPA: ATP-binding protein [Atribacterota bacterium]|nr:ATP-binding protein [Atribacterota bacterium]